MIPLFTYIPLPHLPQIPEKFIKQGMALIESGTAIDQNLHNKELHVNTPEYLTRKIIKNGVEMPTRGQASYFLGEEWESWVRENIHPRSFDTGIRLSIGTSTQHGAHVDNPGKLRFYYLVERGGEEATTIWYMKPGAPIVYNGDTENRNCPYTENNMDELIEIDRTQFPIGQWVLFNGYVLHGVENVTGRRVNFNVSVKPWDCEFNINLPSK